MAEGRWSGFRTQFSILGEAGMLDYGMLCYEISKIM